MMNPVASKMQATLKESLGKEDLRQPVSLIKSMVSELMGTMLLIIIGCGPFCGILSYFGKIDSEAEGSSWSHVQMLSTPIMGLGFGFARMGAV